MLLRAALAAASPGGPRARLSILIFHRVLPETDPLFPGEVTSARFDAICSWVKEWFNVLPLDQAVLRLAQGTLPQRALALTFDDGYADNRTQAAPVLQRHGLPCTFFIATGFLDGGRMWNDTLIESVRSCRKDTLDLRAMVPELGVLPLESIQARRSAIDRLIAHCKYMDPVGRLALVDRIAKQAVARLPSDLMLTSAQVRELRRMGMQVGAHTVNHPILARLPRADALTEMLTSKQTLESILGEGVDLFAYPNGKPTEDYSEETVGLAREAGFSAAVSTQAGVSNKNTDPYQLRRFTPWDSQPWRFGGRLLRNALRSPTA